MKRPPTVLLAAQKETPVSVMIGAELSDQLKTEVKRTGMSKSAIVRIALNGYFELPVTE